MTAPMMDQMLGSTVRERMFHERVVPARLQDQHGRWWSTQLDQATLHPATPLTPDGWAAPFAMLYPPAKYLTVPKGAFGQLRVDYERWLIDAADADKEYRQWLLQVARTQFGAAALQKIQEGDADLRRLAGPPPASIEFIKAMKAGNKWALGIPRFDGSAYPMPPWAAAIVDTLVPAESWDGTGVDLEVEPAAYPDVEEGAAEDAYAVAQRLADAARYADVEEAMDPFALPEFEPVKRAKRKR